jgi:hypothetical protein
VANFNASRLRAQAARAQQQIRTAQSQLRQWQRDVNSAVNNYNSAVNRYNSAARQQNANVRRLQSELRRPVTSTTRTTVRYTPGEQEMLDETFEAVRRDPVERPRDLFLCHAWPDRNGAAIELFAELQARELDVWFSEKDIQLGLNLARQLDRGIACSRVGLVLVTPAFLRSSGWAEEELGALLGSGRVIPVMHEVTFEQLHQHSPMLAGRVGLSTADDTLAEIAEKIAEMVLPAS